MDADTPQSGKYCTSGRGYGEVMLLAQPQPDGSLAFGLLLSTTEATFSPLPGRRDEPEAAGGMRPT